MVGWECVLVGRLLGESVAVRVLALPNTSGNQRRRLHRDMEHHAQVL